MQFEADGSDDEPAPDEDMLPPDTEQNTQLDEDSDEERASTSFSARGPTPGPSKARSLSRRRSSMVRYHLP